SNFRAKESTWRYATIGSEYAVQTSCFLFFSPSMFGVSAVSPPMCRPCRPAAASAASTPVSRSPRSKISQLVLGSRVTAETTDCGVLVPMSEPCCGCSVTLQSGHHCAIAALKALSNSYRIGKTGSEKVWMSALPLDCATTYAATILPHSCSWAGFAIEVSNMAPLGWSVDALVLTQMPFCFASARPEAMVDSGMPLVRMPAGFCWMAELKAACWALGVVPEIRSLYFQP